MKTNVLTPIKNKISPNKNNNKFLTPQIKKNLNEDTSSLILSSKKIEQTSTKINKISLKNAELHSECIKLQQDLDFLARSYNNSFDTIIEVNKSLTEENNKLSDILKQKEQLISEIIELMEKLTQNGINPFNLENIKPDLISQFSETQKNLNSKNFLHPVIQEIINSNPYFSSCDSMKDFINRCIELRDMSKNFQNKRKSYIYDKNNLNQIDFLGQRLNELQKEYSNLQDRKSTRLNSSHNLGVD